jgi:hypothetical protein
MAETNLPTAGRASPEVARALVKSLGRDPDLVTKSCIVGKDGPLRDRVDSYYGCVQAEARRLEPSGATATEVAETAPGQCIDESLQANDEAIICDALIQSSIFNLEATQTAIKEGGRRVAMRTVMEIRAARASKSAPK